MSLNRTCWAGVLTTTLVLASPQPSRADDSGGGTVLTWALVGAGIGAVIGLIAALANNNAAPKKSQSRSETNAFAIVKPRGFQPVYVVSAGADRVSWQSTLHRLEANRFELEQTRRPTHAATLCPRLSLALDAHRLANKIAEGLQL